MGEPYFKVKNICEFNKVAVFSANFSLYTNLSSRVMATLAQFTPELDIYSVDEAFLSLDGFAVAELADYGHKVKRIVERNVGIPVSVGIAPTKTLAKIANRMAKKNPELNGVLSLMDERQQSMVLEKTDVEDIWGVGRKNSLKLRMLGIKNAKQFRDYKNETLIQKIFTKIGRMTQDELRGIPCFALNLEQKKKNEIISSRTFGSSVYELKELREAVANYTTLASEKLRSQKSHCSCIEVYIRTNPFKESLQYNAADVHRLTTPTRDTRKLIASAWQVLDKLYRQGYEYKKALIKISRITDDDVTQLSLLDPDDDEQSKKLMDVIDRINNKEGHQAVKFAACGVDNKAWTMKQTLKSPRFVTGYSELPIAKCAPIHTRVNF